MIRNCICCGVEFETLISKKVSCTRTCSMKQRQKFYGDQYTNKHRSASARNFLRSLSKKKADRRDLSIDFLHDLYVKQEGKCAISGREMTFICGEGRITTNISIDRIDSSVGYLESNIQLVCIQANKMKSELNLEDLVSWAEDIVNHDKRKRK